MGILRKISIVKRLVASFGLLALVILVVGGVNYQGMYYMNMETGKVIGSAPLIDTATKIKMAIRNQQLITSEMLRSESKEDVEPLWRASQVYKDKLSAETDRLRTILNDKTTQFTGTEVLGRLEAALSDVERLHDDHLILRVEEIYQLVLADFINSMQADKSLKKLSSAFAQLEETILTTKTDLAETAAASIASASYTEEYGWLQLLSEVVKQFYDQIVISKETIFDSANSRSSSLHNQLIPTYNNLINGIKLQVSAMKSGKTADDSILPKTQAFDIQAQADIWEKLMQESLLPLGKVFIDLHAEGLKMVDARKTLDKKAGAAAEEIISLLDQIEKMGWDIQESALKSSKSASNQATLASMVVIAGGMALAVILGLLITLSIKRPLGKIIASLRDIAEGEGDLTQRLSEQKGTELGQLSHWFNAFVQTIQSMMLQIREVSESLSSAAEETSNITEKTGEGIREQQVATDQVVTSMQQMVNAVQEVARSTVDAANATQTARQETGNGIEVVMSTVQHISELADEVVATADMVQSLAVDSENIGGVLDVIGGIAGQTNLLALNAAIEAARAGEQGRGFAVVADEVRTLAARTQVATTEIQEMIERLQSAARNAMASMEKSRVRAQEGMQEVSVTGESLRSITTSVDNIAEVNELVASAAEEQNTVAEDIQQNIASISDIAAQTTTGANEMAGSSEHLAELATKLQIMVGNFRV
ncbi:MAG: methyl-accepting chemotaxis protein [Sedimenticola sp.]